MTDDYKKGLVTGLAMQPLAVVGMVSIPVEEPDLCGLTVILGIKTEDGHCAWIDYES